MLYPLEILPVIMISAKSNKDIFDTDWKDGWNQMFWCRKTLKVSALNDTQMFLQFFF